MGGCGKLVVAGGKGWQYEEVFRLAEELGLGDDVVFPGFLPLADLPLWYNSAALFAYPSLYEGFGLPVLEAMACGTPVMAARSSCLPEVVGDAGPLVEPLDVEEWAAQLLRLAPDREERRQLARRGLAQAARFTWTEAARRTSEVYDGCRR